MLAVALISAAVQAEYRPETTSESPYGVQNYTYPGASSMDFESVALKSVPGGMWN